MKDSTRQFVELLVGEEINYSIIEDNGSDSDKADVLMVINNGDYMQNMQLRIFLQESDISIYLKIGQVTQEKASALILKLNEINSKYRFVKFYVEDDSSIFAEIDYDFNKEDAADVCFQACIRIVRIVDECYPEIMKTIW